MNRSQEKGKWGERIAARYLKCKGYQVVACNYSSRYGEIDIIAKDTQYIVFVEVKTRGGSWGTVISPAEAVTWTKRKKMIQTALVYLSKYPTKVQPRFDIIEILERDSQEGFCKLRQIENAFSLEVGDGIF